MTVSTDVAAVTTPAPLPTPPRVRTQGATAKSKGRVGGKHPHQDLPTVVDLRVRLAAFAADGGLELVKSWVKAELEIPLPDDASNARRYGFSKALLIGEAKVSVEKLRQRWQVLMLELGDELEQAVRKPWIRRVAATSTDPVALGRALNAAENLAAEYKRRSLADEVESLLADGDTSRWHVLETRRSILWAENKHLLVSADFRKYRWVRIVSRACRSNASDAQLETLDKAIKEFEAFLRELNRPVGQVGHTSAAQQQRKKAKAANDREIRLAMKGSSGGKKG